jgi:hypothetical protein
MRVVPVGFGVPLLVLGVLSLVVGAPLLVLAVPLLVLGVWLFVSAFLPPSSPPVVRSVAPVQVVRAGTSPLRTPRTDRRHPIDGALRVTGGMLLAAMGLGIMAYW